MSNINGNITTWYGKLPSSWSAIKLKRLSSIVTGNTPSKSDEENYIGGYIPWIKPDNILEDNSLSSAKEKLSTKGLQQARLVPANSALMCCIGTIGKVALNKESCTTNQQINSVIFDTEIWINDFGFYSLIAANEEFCKNSNKVVVPILNKGEQGNVFMPAPPIDIQKLIAKFLKEKIKQIESVIKDKERLIQLLEEKHQAMITEAVTKGFNPNVKMKDSGVEWIGEIPEHWDIKKIKYLTQSKLMYGANESAELDDRTLPRYIRITDIDQHGNLKDDTFKSLPKEIADQYPVIEGDILFARSGATVGKSYYHGSKEIASFAGYLIRLRARKEYNSKYLYYYTQSSIYKEWIQSILIQATIQNVSAEKYANLEIPIPPLSEINQIVEHIEEMETNIYTVISLVKEQIQKLKEYRQSLIYEAVTGKIDVRDFEVKA